MWQTYIFGMYWEHEGKMYYDEIPAESADEAANYFNHHKRDDPTTTVFASLLARRLSPSTR